MAIRVEKVGDSEKAIVLTERFDFECVGPFRQTYESIEDVKNQTILIDFRETLYIDSSALGMLINARSYFDTHGAKVKLVNANQDIKKIFSISRFDKKFEIS